MTKEMILEEQVGLWVQGDTGWVVDQSMSICWINNCWTLTMHQVYGYYSVVATVDKALTLLKFTLWLVDFKG